MRKGSLIRCKFRCSTCGTETDDFAAVDPENVVELEGSRGEANHAQSCSGCGSSFNVQVGPIASGIAADRLEPDGDGAELVTLEIRGAEPVDFEAGEDSFEAISPSDTSFEVDLSEGEWADYDEASDTALSIMEPSFEWTKAEASKKKKKGAKRK